MQGLIRRELIGWRRYLHLASLIVVLLMPAITRAEMPRRVQAAVVSGQFYPSDPEVLRHDIQQFLDQAGEAPDLGEPFILFTPHAGYRFSGSVAAHAFAQLARTEVDTVVLIAFSHFVGFTGVSIFDGDAYETPLGEVALDQEFIRALKEKDPRFFSFVSRANEREHSLEVQLPFLQVVAPHARVVPLVMGDFSKAAAENLAKLLWQVYQEEKTKRVVFLVTSDLSHYHPYDQAISVDAKTLKEVVSLDPETISDAVVRRKIEACGIGPIQTLAFLSQWGNKKKATVLKYANSGDTTGDRSRVVGYAALFISKPEDRKPMNLRDDETSGYSREEKKALLEMARATLQGVLRKGKRPVFEVNDPHLREPLGVFVTLHKAGRLRGCIGCFGSEKPLFETVQDFAMNAALRDPRFPKVTADELDVVDIEISILSPLKRIQSPEEIALGKHGIWIRKGAKSGTYLPQVATETGWTVEEFLGHCAAEKAGIGWDGWREAELYIYTTDVFSEQELKD